MIKVLVEFCIDADIIECPDWIVKDLGLYQTRFREWLSDENNDHSYWCYKNGKKVGSSFRSDAFVEWLNKFVLYNQSEKSKVLEECVSSETGNVCRVVYPTYINDRVESLRDDFMTWMEEEDEQGNIRLDIYTKVYGGGRRSSYSIMDWMNQFVLNESEDKAFVIDKQVDIEEIKNMPVIYF